MTNWGSASKTCASIPQDTAEHNSRELVAFCRGCWHFTDFRHNKGTIAALELTTKLKIDACRTANSTYDHDCSYFSAVVSARGCQSLGCRFDSVYRPSHVTRSVMVQLVKGRDCSPYLSVRILVTAMSAPCCQEYSCRLCCSTLTNACGMKMS